MRTLGFLTLFCTVSTVLVAADNPYLGTWKINSAKSKFSPGTEIKAYAVTFASDGEQVKRTATGTDSDGLSIHQSSTVAWDGKDHPIDAPGMTAAVKRNHRDLNATIKNGEKVVDEIQCRLSKDGKVMTLTEKGFDPKGRALDNIEIFDKQ